MSDREIIQAFLVADEVLARLPFPPKRSQWITTVEDARMPQDVVAVGRSDGTIVIHPVEEIPG